MHFVFSFLKKALAVLIVFAGCAGCTKKQRPDIVLINGAGASFPYLIYSKWFAEYRSIDPKTTINYQSIGSAGGVRQFLKGTLDFGATDLPVVPSESKNIIHIPTVLGAVAVTYNLPLAKPLKLDGKVLARIWTGGIQKWNDPAIQALNPKASLPSDEIVTLYRADASGTTAFWTDYLSQADSDFAKKVGKGKVVNWPLGVGGKGNEGVVGMVKKIKGSIAYIGASYGAAQKLSMALLKNRDGFFVPPNEETVKAAARHAMKAKKGYKESLILAPGKNAYPISAFTYFIFSAAKPAGKKRKAFLKFLRWAVEGKGQALAPSLYFVPLPDNVKKTAGRMISQMQRD